MSRPAKRTPLSEFMRTLGIYSSDGKAYTRLHDQMDRLFHSSVELTYEHQQVRRFVASHIVVRGEFWWDPKRPDDRSLWDSKIELGENFFNEIINRPVPLNMNALAALKRSALGLDFYLWLVYRTFALRAPLRLSWPSLYRQFGVDPDKANNTRTVDDFRTDSLRELKKIKTRLAGVELCDGQGRVDPLSLDSPRLHPRLAHSASWSSPRIAQERPKASRAPSLVGPTVQCL